MSLILPCTVLNNVLNKNIFLYVYNEKLKTLCRILHEMKTN